MSSLVSLSLAQAALVEAAAAHVVAVRNGEIAGSGVVWADGLVVTTHHTTPEHPVVVLPDGSSAAASVIGRDRTTDLALLAVPGVALAAPTWRTGPARVGEWVATLSRGHHGIRASFAHLGAVGGAWQSHRGGTIDRYLDVDGSLAFGASGGPLVAADGAFLGVNTHRLTRGGTTIPAETVARVVERLRSRGTVAPGWLGVGAHAADLGEAQRAATGQDGAVLIANLVEGGPAAKAGLLPGDAVLSLGGTAVKALPDMLGVLADLGAGATTVVRALRGREVVAVQVVLGEKPRSRC